MPQETLLLIDANSLVHRAFHALPALTTPQGKPSGALYGLASIILKLLKEQRPTYCAAFFDRPEPTFRDKLYADYKAHRPPTDNMLLFQIKEAPHLFEQFGVLTFSESGFEADDLIGTFVDHFKKTMSSITSNCQILRIKKTNNMTSKTRFVNKPQG